MTHNHESKHQENVKAGALLCPVCCVEYVEVVVDFDIDGVILKNVKALRCPVCQEEQFTEQQRDAVEERLRKASS